MPFFRKVKLNTWNQAKPAGVENSQWTDLYNAIKLPVRATLRSAGYDFHAPFGFTLSPGDSIVIPTGIKFYTFAHEFLMIAPRSSHGFKYFARLANTVAIGDADYYDNPDNEGHYFIKLRNEGDKDWTVEKGDRFAQGIILPFAITDDDTPLSEKRQGGLGSTN